MWHNRPSTKFHLVPLPVPGRIYASISLARGWLRNSCGLALRP